VNPTAIVILALVLAIVCGAISAAIARSNGRSAVSYFVLGFVFGVFGVLITAVVGRSTAPPKGWGSVDCPRCNTRQNVQLSDDEFQCYNCNYAAPTDRY
jgi:hypothetical protein